MWIKVPFILLFWAGAGLAQPQELRGMGGGWNFNLSGTARDGNLIYDFERDLAIAGRGHRSLQLEWDTPAGWWPDVAVSWSQIDAQGRRDFAGTPPLTGPRTIITRANNDDVDLTLRYPFQWDSLRASIGISIKWLGGDIVIDDSDEAQPSRQRYDEFVPQLHVAAQWPFTQLLALNAAGQAVEYQGNRAMEYRATLEVRLFEPLRIEAGWQEKRYDLEAGAYALDATMRGLLLRVGMVFRP